MDGSSGDPHGKHQIFHRLAMQVDGVDEVFLPGRAIGEGAFEVNRRNVRRRQNAGLEPGSGKRNEPSTLWGLGPKEVEGNARHPFHNSRRIFELDTVLPAAAPCGLCIFLSLLRTCAFLAEDGDRTAKPILEGSSVLFSEIFRTVIGAARRLRNWRILKRKN